MPDLLFSTLSCVFAVHVWTFIPGSWVAVMGAVTCTRRRPLILCIDTTVLFVSASDMGREEYGIRATRYKASKDCTSPKTLGSSNSLHLASFSWPTCLLYLLHTAHHVNH